MSLNEGLEFSDVISKDRNFYIPTSENPHTVLILCDVSLGRIFNKKKNTENQFPKYFHSTWSRHKIVLTCRQTETLDERTRFAVNSAIKSNLFYNHFRVRDIDQVDAKFLVSLGIDFQHT